MRSLVLASMLAVFPACKQSSSFGGSSASKPGTPAAKKGGGTTGADGTLASSGGGATKAGDGTEAPGGKEIRPCGQVIKVDLAACKRNAGCELKGTEPGKHHPTLTTPRDTFRPGEVINLSYANPEFTADDWITVVPKGFEDNSWCPWFWSGQQAGVYQFEGLPEGEYELRAYYGWKSVGQCEVVARKPFRVAAGAPLTQDAAGSPPCDDIIDVDLAACSRHSSCELKGTETGRHHPVLTTAKTSYKPGEVIDLAYDNPGFGEGDWITVVPANYEDNSWCPWFWSAQASGSYQFQGLPEGDYELRAFYGWRSRGECEVVTRLPLKVRN